MAKFLLLLAATGLLLVVMAEAATKTIFTATTTFNENPAIKRTDMSCKEQMVEQQGLDHCLMYLGSGMSQGQERMSGPTPEQHMELCCMQLRNIDEPCRCEALNVMMSIQRWLHGMAENLPEKCNFEPEMCKKHSS